MKLRVKLIFCLVLVLCHSAVIAQSDSTRSFSFEQFMKLVTDHHPVARQADLQLMYGDAAVMKAKGAFDPKLQADLSQKYFDGKQYYSLIDGGLKVPTWFGAEFKAGYEVNNGVFLNEQNTTPGPGLLYAGISIPIGQGLIIDKRRAELKKAKIFSNGTALQRTVILNNLLFEAGTVYWEWYRYYQELQINKNALAVATDRLKAVRQTAVLGERSFIDTVEAGIQVQNRQLQYRQSQLHFTNATALLSIYLWSEGAVPLELSEFVTPIVGDDSGGIETDPAYYLKMDTLINGHPELTLYTNKLDQLAIEERWKREQLKPTLNLNYNPITEPVGGSSLGTFSPNNYTLGMTFSMPVLLRKERGELRMTDIKIQETVLDQRTKQAQLIYKANASLNEWQTAYEQVLLYEETVLNNERLLNGERNLFDNGESSLFMINARELSYIKAQQKLIELKMKNRIAELKTKYAFGLLCVD